MRKETNRANEALSTNGHSSRSHKETEQFTRHDPINMGPESASADNATDPKSVASAAASSATRWVKPGLPFHEAAEVFPELTGDPYEELKKDIAKNGQAMPAYVHEGQIIDGRTRQKIARELGQDLLVKEWDGNGSLPAFVASLNLHRRHLDETQRALVAARLQPLFEAEAKERMLKGKAADPTANLSKGPARDQAAAVMNVSPRSVQSAKKVLEAGTPALNEAVQSGEATVSAASEIADLSKEEQDATVADGPKQIQARARELRAKKARKRRKQAKQADSTAQDKANAEGNGDNAQLTVSRPANQTDRKKLARHLLDYLGVQECKEIAKIWRGSSAKPKPKSKPKPKPKSKPKKTTSKVAAAKRGPAPRPRRRGRYAETSGMPE